MLKHLFMAVSLITIIGVFGCGKKDEGGPVAVGCPPQHEMSPVYGSCLARANCPIGLVQHPSMPAQCISAITGEVLATQQCGPGFVLTKDGCLPQGPCKQYGQALRGDVCVDIVQVPQSYGSSYNSQFGNGYGTGGGYTTQPGGYAQPGGYPQQPYGYGGNFGYRPF